jgi:hypothetical protein
MGSGSDRVQLVPLDRSSQGGSNGVSWNVVVAVLAEIWLLLKVAVEKWQCQNMTVANWYILESGVAVAGWQ